MVVAQGAESRAQWFTALTPMVHCAERNGREVQDRGEAPADRCGEPTEDQDQDQDQQRMHDHHDHVAEQHVEQGCSFVQLVPSLLRPRLTLSAQSNRRWKVILASSISWITATRSTSSADHFGATYTPGDG